MRLMTNKFKKVAKVPVEVEDKFCSHIDPGTSAQLIAAHELAQLDPKNKFNQRWRDKEFVPRIEDFKQVPKHFYSNFKTNLIRDAHYMAKAIVQNRSHSPIQGGRASAAGSIQHADTCPGSHNASVKCNCKAKQVSIKRKFRSYIGWIRSHEKSKKVTKTSYDLYKPYRPCRRTCCSTKNPLFHAQRMQ